jgi:hypothetical protein
VLDLGAERARFKRETASGFGTLRVERFDAVAAMFGDRRSFDDAPRTSVPEIWQLHALTVGAALRNPWLVAQPDTAGGKDVRDARQRHWELYSTLASAAAPPDWKRWTSSALDVERYIHAGTAGVTDESYYALLGLYMARTHAPDRARQSIAMRHALASWDFKAASALADSLAPSAIALDAWMSTDEIREGGMIAKLKLGDPLAARKFWVAMSPVATRPPDALRSLLLDSYLIDAYKKAARR